jgi:pantothenate kinase
LSNFDYSLPISPASPPVFTATLDELVARARAVIATGGRKVLGITGPRGAGKSTLCTALLEALGDAAVLVGMDGFHLANQELLLLGRQDRKGAPDTFDADGYVALLRRICSQSGGAPIYAPVFDRQLEESIGSAVPVSANTSLVITEGNYLLLRGDGWEALRDCLDEAWYLEVPPDLRTRRMVSRRQGFGESVAEATAWVQDVDDANAAIVEPTRAFADLVIHLDTQLTGHGRDVRNTFYEPAASADLKSPTSTLKEH